MNSSSLLRPFTDSLTVADLLDLDPTWEFLSSQAGEDGSQVSVCGISLDSNDLEPGWAFAGVPGQQRHGATFADGAHRSGATILVTDREGSLLPRPAQLPVLVVDDVRGATGKIASALHHEVHDKLVKIGVTGTNGKTTTTFFTRAALAPRFTQTAVLGTLGIDTGTEQIAVDRTTSESPIIHRALALSAQQGSTAAVIEVSSHAMSFCRVGGLVFDVAVFTNLQHDHLDFYGDMDNYFTAKAKLFAPSVSKRAVIALDDSYGRKLASEIQIPAVGVVTNAETQLSSLPISYWQVTETSPDPSGGTRFTLCPPDDAGFPEGVSFQAVSPLPGPANVQDAALALVAAHEVGVPMADATRSLAASGAVPGRSQWVQLPSESMPGVIVDFGHTPEAIEALLQTLRPLTKGRLIGVFGAEGDRDPSKRAPLGEVYATLADELWVTDESPRDEDASQIREQLLEGIRRQRPSMVGVYEVTTCRRDAIREALLGAMPGDIVAITGKGHERYQIFSGVKHAFYDPDVVQEVLAAYSPAKAANQIPNK